METRWTMLTLSPTQCVLALAPSPSCILAGLRLVQCAMASETVTRTIECDGEPEIIYRKLTDVSLIPQWAPVFADRVESASETTFRITKGDDVFDMELLANERALTVDYLRGMGDGRRGGAYIRVMPKPLGGSVVAMTVPVGPKVTPDQVATVLEQELATLINLTSKND